MYIIDYYTENNITPVYEFIMKQNPKVKAKMLRDIDLLEKHGFHLGYPYITRISGTDELWELRTRFASNNYRTLFFHYKEGAFVLLHAFSKKAGRIPLKEIKIAQKRLEKYKKGK